MKENASPWPHRPLFTPEPRSFARGLAWKEWSGYFAASSYREFVQPEYAAIRHAAALIDVSPLYKYRVEGADATAFLNRVVTQNVAKMAVGQVVYTPWCDADGTVRQEGTLFRLGDDAYRLCAAEPALGWLQLNAEGAAVEFVDESTSMAALSLQGPNSRAVLREAGFTEVDDLQFFRHQQAEIGGAPVEVSRTGYTGDLGYELWLDAEAALTVWDALMDRGEPFLITPCGIVAMDVARVEAGFILIGVDYVSSEVALVEADKSSPYELGLGWTVKLKKGPFIGRRALREGRKKGYPWQLVGLQIDWDPLEKLFMDVGLMPDLPYQVHREPVPLYAGLTGPQVGQVTSRVWSALLKKYIAIATVESAYAKAGTELAMEVTVRYSRKRASARVVKMPFFRPERAKA